MNSHSKILLQALFKEKSNRTPFWFMRQAGRYLPEYRAVRGKARDFLDFCYSPDLASEATLQPIKRFGMDGAIIFSDILVVPHALGVEVHFEEGRGPVLQPVQEEKALAALTMEHLPKRLFPVYEALRRTQSLLPKETTLIGFAGAPWTLACYILQGQADRDFQKARSLAMTRKEFFSRLMALLVEAVSAHALRQIEAGAEVIQLFDSWAGVLNERQFADWVIAPTKAIVATIKAQRPSIPIIGFPRLAGSKVIDYVKHTGVDAVNIDASVSLAYAKEIRGVALQGNLDPLVLAEDKQAMLAQAKEIISTLSDNSFVFNLGHGILPHTPIENVQALCDFLKAQTR